MAQCLAEYWQEEGNLSYHKEHKISMNTRNKYLLLTDIKIKLYILARDTVNVTISSGINMWLLHVHGLGSLIYSVSLA
jgi:hypothetical protein